MNKDKKILIVEDDPEISTLLHTIIQKTGMGSVQAYSGTEGQLQLQHNTYDLIILDLMLPGISGEEFINQIRAKSAIPIIVITAKVDIEDKVRVLRMGADDYITKPFNQEEVIARMEVQLRKSAVHSLQTSEKIWRSLNIYPDKLCAYLGNTELHLTNAEFDILSLFVSNPERAFSKK